LETDVCEALMSRPLRPEEVVHVVLRREADRKHVRNAMGTFPQTFTFDGGLREVE